MRWMLWGRQTGKTYQTIEWWLEDPENRVILCHDANVAREIRYCILEKHIRGKRPELDSSLAVWKQLADKHVMSWRTWQNERLSAKDSYHRGKLIALDGLEGMVHELIGGEVGLINAAGFSEQPKGLAFSPAKWDSRNVLPEGSTEWR